MVVSQGEYDGEDKPYAQPDALFLQEVELISVTIERKGPCAVQHNQPNSDQGSNSQNQNVGALFIHSNLCGRAKLPVLSFGF